MLTSGMHAHANAFSVNKQTICTKSVIIRYGLSLKIIAIAFMSGRHAERSVNPFMVTPLRAIIYGRHTSAPGCGWRCCVWMW